MTWSPTAPLATDFPRARKGPSPCSRNDWVSGQLLGSLQPWTLYSGTPLTFTVTPLSTLDPVDPLFFPFLLDTPWSNFFVCFLSGVPSVHGLCFVSRVDSPSTLVLT